MTRQWVFLDTAGLGFLKQNRHGIAISTHWLAIIFSCKLVEVNCHQTRVSRIPGEFAMPTGRKLDLSPTDLKLAAGAFEAALVRLHEMPCEMNPHSLRRKLASHVMDVVFAGEDNVQMVVDRALARVSSVPSASKRVKELDTSDLV